MRYHDLVREKDFFFQAEDDIRGGQVAEVQTYALPITPQVQYPNNIVGSIEYSSLGKC